MLVENADLNRGELDAEKFFDDTVKHDDVSSGGTEKEGNPLHSVCKYHR